MRVFLGLCVLAALVCPLVLVLLVCLPSRVARIYVSNFFGRAIGKGIILCSGCSVEVEGREHLDRAGPEATKSLRTRAGPKAEAKTTGPILIAMNHTSVLDAFTSIALVPRGTVGVAKRGILLTPFFGQAWWLAGQLLIDRGNSQRAKASINSTSRFASRHGLSICILPEGTRSRDGNILPLKKGIGHLALQLGFPIVPLVGYGAHLAWPKGKWSPKPWRILMKASAPIDTSTWTLDTLEDNLEALRHKMQSDVDELRAAAELPPKGPAGDLLPGARGLREERP